MPTFELRLADGTPADPPILNVNAPTWNVRDVIPLGPADRFASSPCTQPMPTRAAATRETSPRLAGRHVPS